MNITWFSATALAAVAMLACESALATTGWSGDTIQALGVYDGYPQTDVPVSLPDGSMINVLAYEDYGDFTVPGSAAGGLSLSFDLYTNQIDILAAPGPSTMVTTIWLPMPQNGYDFFDTSNNPGIVSVSLDAASTADGASNADVEYNSYSVEFNFAGQIWYGGTEAIYDVTFGPAGPVPGPLQGAPEPATWVMSLLGLTGVGAALRSRRQRPAAAAA